ncbi:cellulose binding domain-containing protein [Dactylosporangium sp. NPDC050688]|uniref:cellulose binding domain-containing protein n=1 Tax=Dactylosporangium sp. NPDC050688 TaxID=3157217 RepID=UPI0033D06F69
MSRQFRALAVAAVSPLAWAGPAAADAVPAGPFSCDYRFFAWSGGFVADLTVANHGPAVTGWTASWTFRSATGNLTAWQAKMAQPDPFTVTATNESYNAVIGTGRSVRFGWTASAASTEVPSDITVNGVPC